MTTSSISETLPAIPDAGERALPQDAFAKDAARFWAKVDTSGECWVWTATRYSNGYGCFWYDTRGQRAHRVSWQLHFGSIPDDQNVLHRCDNPLCVNPAHLFLGSQKDNMVDASQKNRVCHGERILGAKLTAESVRVIRQRHQAGESIKALACQFDVAPRTIRETVCGKRWRRV